jgi:hypothetical protein
MMPQFKDCGRHLLWGEVGGNEPQHLIKMGLLLRNQRLVSACYGLVDFKDGQSRCSIFTIKWAMFDFLDKLAKRGIQTAHKLACQFLPY